MKVQIPFPCNVSPDKFTKVEGGKHCSACDKVVVEFTKMTTEEIQNYFVQKADETICGSYSREDVKDIEYAIPLEVVQSNQRNARNVIIICFLVAFGFMSFNINAQNNEEVVGGMPGFLIDNVVDTNNSKNDTDSINFTKSDSIDYIFIDGVKTQIRTIMGGLKISDPIKDTI